MTRSGVAASLFVQGPGPGPGPCPAARLLACNLYIYLSVHLSIYLCTYVRKYVQYHAPQQGFCVCTDSGDMTTEDRCPSLGEVPDEPPNP